MISFVVAALLFYGNALFEVDAFQATKFSPTTSFSKFDLVSQSFGDACVARSPQSRGCKDPQRRRRLFVASAVSQKTDTASIDVGDSEATNEFAIEPEGSFRIQNANDGEEDFFPTPTPIVTTVTYGRKRRAIQKIREKHFSKPIDSRFASTMLFPLRIFIWKPLWMVMDIFINRLDEDGSADSDSGHISSARSSDITETIAVTATPQHVVTMTTPDTVESAGVNQKDSAILEPSIKPTSNIEIQEETVDMMPSQPAAATSEEKKDTIENKDENVAATLDANPAIPKPAVATSEGMKDIVENTDENVPTTLDSTPDTPKGDRWAVAAPGVDLSGKWELIVTPDFKKNYDRYLEGLGQPKIVRSVALSGPVIGQTMEELMQIDCGESLLIRGKNVRGTWDRTLHASGATKHSQDFEPLISPILTVDQEVVEAEAWWEDQGTAHVSWMRGVTMYGGGSFYSRRYFEEKEHEDDETVYACEGFFEFNDPKKGKNELTWRFRRQT